MGKGAVFMYLGRSANTSQIMPDTCHASGIDMSLVNECALTCKHESTQSPCEAHIVATT